MNSKIFTADYWFTIEPYVFVSVTNKCVLLYNTLDGGTLESEKPKVIELLREMLLEKNCGVVLLKNEEYEQEDIHCFVQELRSKFMGDVIDITLSKGKPVQSLPYVNYFEKDELYKKLNFSLDKNVLKNLVEISINVDATTDLTVLIPFLKSIPGIAKYNLIGNIKAVKNYNELLSFLDQHPSKKSIQCSYADVMPLQPEFNNKFSYKLSVRFPVEMEQWENSRQMLHSQTLPVAYIFDLFSEEDHLQAERFAEQYQLEEYQLNPVYTGDNIRFFEENVFLTKEDILSTPLTLKDFFIHQSMNVSDFGKINILPNGEVYANIHYPALGNIDTHSIHEIVYNELEKGKSWFRTRNETPCKNCVYQWLCPPPSNYEIAIGRCNLCHVNN